MIIIVIILLKNYHFHAFCNEKTIVITLLPTSSLLFIVNAIVIRASRIIGRIFLHLELFNNSNKKTNPSNVHSLDV